jgi:hypothetical protein
MRKIERRGIDKRREREMMRRILARERKDDVGHDEVDDDAVEGSEEIGVAGEWQPAAGRR